MTTRTGEPEDPRMEGARGPRHAVERCGTCLGPHATIDCGCNGGPCFDDQPEPVEPVLSTCHYCGATFEGAGDDCGACPLTDPDLTAYARDRAPPSR